MEIFRLFFLFPVLKALLIIVDEIALHSEDNFNFSACGGNSLRKRLNNAVVCDGYRLVSPGYGTLDKELCVRHAVHHGHFGVQMQLNALFLSVVNRRNFLNC